MSKITKYTPVDFSYLLGQVNGIDDDLMKIHFKLYEGLVGATNASIEKIRNGVNDLVDYNGIQKEFSFFFNGMRLHEMYFGVMSGKNMDKIDPNLTSAINQSFGSFVLWKKNFMETGTIPGVGFVALCRDRETGLLINLWINEFNIGELIGVDILLVMDMWEHAFLCQFGLDINTYQETFLKNVNWSVVSKYYMKSIQSK
jgi:Fe-Mn family superoxide dismutase